MLFFFLIVTRQTQIIIHHSSPPFPHLPHPSLFVWPFHLSPNPSHLLISLSLLARRVVYHLLYFLDHLSHQAFARLSGSLILALSGSGSLATCFIKNIYVVQGGSHFLAGLIFSLPRLSLLWILLPCWALFRKSIIKSFHRTGEGAWPVPRLPTRRTRTVERLPKSCW